MCENSPRLELVRARPKNPYMPKINPGDIPVSSINSVHINIVYIFTHIYLKGAPRSDLNICSLFMLGQ